MPARKKSLAGHQQKLEVEDKTSAVEQESSGVDLMNDANVERIQACAAAPNARAPKPLERS